MNVTVLTFTPDDHLAIVLVWLGIVIVTVALFVANHNLKDRF